MIKFKTEHIRRKFFTILILIVTLFLATSSIASDKKQPKILLHTGAIIEPLVNSKFQKDYEIIRKIVDGYYFLRIPIRSYLSYWENRPAQCFFSPRLEKEMERVGLSEIKLKSSKEQCIVGNYENGYCIIKKEDAKPLLNYCRREYNRYKNSIKDYSKLVANKEKALLKKLGLPDPSKKIVAPSMFGYEDYEYDATADTIVVKQLPPPIQMLTNNNIPIDWVMVYKEPGLANYPDVPDPYINDPCFKDDNQCTHLNLKTIDLIYYAYQKFYASNGLNLSLAPKKFLSNVRNWRKSKDVLYPKSYPKEVSSFIGVNFEDSCHVRQYYYTGSMDCFKKLSLPGLIWIMKKHPEHLIELLLPFGDIPPERVNEYNQLVGDSQKIIKTYIDYLKEIDKLLSKEGLSICTDQIILVPAGYGQYYIPPAFPIFKSDGSLEATIGGVIYGLKDFLNKYCK